MNLSILEWLLEEQNPEVQLRTLKEYMKLPDDDEKVIECRRLLLQSKTYERALKKLRKDKPWDNKAESLTPDAEWNIIQSAVTPTGAGNHRGGVFGVGSLTGSMVEQGMR